ncbi:hypothetical protein [Edaphovirga cremea]|uniref:hypothetical protein n=1 Tax=Edaphovirga cremea TaxID=2267246 RepID=UPI00398A3F7E
MGLDVYLTSNNNEIIHIVISEDLHKNIFTSSSRWSSYKTLRKIKDYYRADCILKGENASSFLSELEGIKDSLTNGKEEIIRIFEKIQGEKIISIRVCSD